MENGTGNPVLVTTKHRGVFFGYADAGLDNGTITIKRARTAIYWSQDMRGVLGLASAGPSRNCKISGAVTAIELTDVTAIVQCAPEAVEKWEAAPRSARLE